MDFSIWNTSAFQLVVEQVQPLMAEDEEGVYSAEWTDAVCLDVDQACDLNTHGFHSITEKFGILDV